MESPTIKVPDAGRPTGKITVRGYRAGAIEDVMPYVKTLMEWRRLAWKAAPGLARDRILRAIQSVQEKIDEIFAHYAIDDMVSVTDNLIMTGSLTGRDLLVQYLIGGTIYNGGLNYGALGTSQTAPAVTDTELGAEVVRTGPSIQNDLTYQIAQLQFYMPDVNVPNETYYEAGTFMGGTASLNSGQLFNHALLGTPYAKTSGTDTTLQVEITFN